MARAARSSTPSASYTRPAVGRGEYYRTNREGPSLRGGFIPGGTAEQDGTVGDNDAVGGTLNQSVLGFPVGCIVLMIVLYMKIPHYVVL